MAPAENTKVRVRDIRAGDALAGVWTASEDAQVGEDGRVRFSSQAFDIGGHRVTEYADPDYEVTVLRAA